MSTGHGGGRRDGTHFPGEPCLSEPGLEPLIRALTASGHPHEHAGRDAALAVFRAASQPREASRAAESIAQRTRGSGTHDYPGRPRRALRLLLTARLSAICAAGFTVLAGFTAAAYAQALPAPVQQVAHSVLAPLGVPDSKPQPGLPGGGSSGAVSSGGAASSGTSSSAGASPPATSVSVTTSPGASGQAAPAGPASGPGRYVITLTAASVRVTYGMPDLFTAQLAYRGRPAAGVRVRLLERVTGSVVWQVVASGVTGKQGRAALSDPGLTMTAAFRLALSGGVRSVAVRVTVGPAIRMLLVRGTLRDRMMVAAPAGAPGEDVSLLELVGGTWERVATKPLGPRLRAEFTLPVSSAAGHLYRAELAATSSETAAGPVSNRVWIPRQPGTGAGDHASR